MSQSKGPLFIDRGVFTELMQTVPNRSAKAYADTKGAYGDLSRLVVSWVSRLEHAEMQRLYTEYGWKGNVSARAIRACALEWLKRHHPELPK